MKANHSQQTPSGGSDDRLVRLLRSGWTPFADEISAIMEEAATQIELLLSQRKEWKCSVGNEDFVTDQEDVAQEWRDDGLEVVSYFVPNAKTEGPPTETSTETNQ